MKNKLSILAASLLAALATHAGETPSFNTGWITAKPEVLTYRTTSSQGDGLYQLSIWKTTNGMQLYMNIISPGFTKSVWADMAADLHPRESRSRILVNGQIGMTTDCAYTPNRLHISTLMSPYNRVEQNTISISNFVVDFSQTPLLPRVLAFKPGADFRFESLDPHSNTLMPLTLRVVGEETIQGVACYKVAGSDFEGKNTLWIEKGATHRVIRIEQPERVTQLILGTEIAAAGQ